MLNAPASDGVKATPLLITTVRRLLEVQLHSGPVERPRVFSLGRG
jgi:hypothetical protein